MRESTFKIEQLLQNAEQLQLKMKKSHETFEVERKATEEKSIADIELLKSQLKDQTQKI